MLGKVSKGQDSATFWDKGTEVPSLSRDKGTTGQAQNLAKGRDGLVQDFDSLSRHVPQEKTGQSRKERSKKGKGRFKTVKDVLKQKRMF